MKKRILSMLLALVMLATMLPLGLIDTAEAAVSSGTCGEHVYWTLTNDGTLTISGKGTMADYVWNGAPWYGFRSEVKTVIIYGVTNIGDRAFQGCSSLTSITIPDSVTSIGWYAFQGCSSLTSVTIPNSVTSIGAYAFYGCKSLTSVTIPNSVTSIGEHTFSNCTSLTSVTIPNSVTSVGEWAFTDCTSLTSVTIPNSVTSIGSNAFNGSNAAITVASGNSEYCSVSGALYNKQKTTLFYPGMIKDGSFRIPNSVTTIADHAFRDCSSLTSVTIPNSVTSIGDYAFYDCSSLTSVTIPSSVTSIGSGAFGGCKSLTDVYYDGSETDWLTLNGHDQIPDSATVHFKDNLYDSGTCGENVKWTLTKDGTLTISGTGAMYNYDVIDGSNPAPWCANGLSNRVRTVVVKKGITELGYDVFAECSELQKVTLPSGLTRIGSCAFIDCYSLPELTIPATVTTIESNAFTNCNSIKTLTLPGGLKEIGDAACSQMESLSSVTLGKGITRLSPYMFNMCYALTSVTVPEGVTDIGSCAFRYCESLQTMHLPASLKTVGEGASSGTNIADVYFASTAARWNALRMEPGNNHIRCAKVHYRNAAAVPAAPKIKLMNSGNQFQLSWDAVPGAASYQVYRIVDSTVEDYTLLGTTKSTTFTDKTAKTGTTYTFAVKAANANGESMMSSSCAGKLSAAPANVTLGAAKVVNGGIQVTWQAAANAATYNVYRMGPGDTYWKVVSAKQSGTSYTDKNVTAGSTYKYTVRGVASDGTTLSPSYDGTGKSATAAPANVTMGQAKVSGNTIVVTWQAAAGAEKYRVYRMGPGDTYWKVVSAKQSGTSYTDKNVTAGGTYKYTVRGVAADGTTLSPSYDGTGKSATMPKAPDRVTVTSAVVSGDTIIVTWQKAANAATYTVYRMGPGDTYWKVVSTKQSGTSYTDKNVKLNSTYKYTVRGVAADGTTLSLSYDGAGVSATMPKAPDRVIMSNAVANGNTIVVTWQAAAGAATYNVYRMGPGDTYWKVVSAKQSGTSYTDKNVKPNSTYKYTVRGVAADGTTLSKGYDSKGVTQKTPATVTPSVVVLQSAKADAAGITVTWQAAANAATYNVYRKGPSDTYWKVIASKISGTSYKDTSTARNTEYTYTVRGVAADGTTLSPSYDGTGVSAKVTASPSATPAYVTMKSAVRVTSGTKGILLTWTTANNAKTYNVYRAANPPTDSRGNPTAVSASKWVLVGEKVDGLSFKDTTGKSGTTYAYTVRGVAADGKTLSPTYNKFGLRITMP